MWKNYRAITVITILFASLTISYSILIPAFNAPDEPFHFEYIRFLAEKKSLPNQTVEELSLSTEGFNPPLYYMVNAILLGIISKDNASDIGIHTFEDLVKFNRNPSAGFRGDIYPPLNPQYSKLGWGVDQNMFLTAKDGRFPFAGSIRSIHLLRAISVLFGALTVFFIFKAAKTLFPDNDEIAILAASVCAFNPQFTFLSGTLNNDNLVILFSSISIWLLTKLATSDSYDVKLIIALGGFIGLGLISKVNIAFLALISIAIIIYKFLEAKPKKPKELIKVLLLFLLPLIAISGWYFLINIFNYGLDDPLGWRLRAHQNPDLVLDAGSRVYFFKEVFPARLFTSFWGRFDWLTIGLPRWMYILYGIISSLVILGVVKLLQKENERDIKVCGLFYLAVILMAIASLISLNFTFASAQGRLIFTSIACISILIAAGFYTIVDYIGKFKKLNLKIAVALFVLFLIGLNIYTLTGVIYPVYR